MCCAILLLLHNTKNIIVMATVKAFIRTSNTVKANKKDSVNVRFRLSAGRSLVIYYKSEIKVNPNQFDNAAGTIKTRILIDNKVRSTVNKEIQDMKSLILDIYNDYHNSVDMTTEWLTDKINAKINGTDGEKEKMFFDIFEEFLTKHKVSKCRKASLSVTYRVMRRYELYKQVFDDKYKLEIDNVTHLDLTMFDDFLKNEYKICGDDNFAHLYEIVSETRTPKERGQNTCNSIMSKLRTFYLWSINEKYTTNNPFLKYKIGISVYGTPYYINIDERNILYKSNMSNKQLEMQRDIFVFQCVVGCRVGDLYRMTRGNIINGAIEYIPSKTKDDRVNTVRVPLNKVALEILDKYSKVDTKNKLLPFIAEQKYNIYIKQAFLEAGITRMVTIINPTTGSEEKRPINEIASSHLARRCFVGNLYKQVKDPNLVGALSGHCDGSRAFARYREIDEDMKKELVSLLE